MLNKIWLGMIVVSMICAVITGHIPQLVNAVTDGAMLGFEMAFKLTGIMAFWLGLMKIAEEGGLILAISRWIKPVMVRLFPDVPAEHPAMGAMLMNIAANFLGLGNAATPFGLKAMNALQTLNKQPDTATNAMCMFLALNTSSIQLLPVSGMMYLASGGAHTPQDIIVTAILATTCSTAAGIVLAKIFQRLPKYQQTTEVT